MGLYEKLKEKASKEEGEREDRIYNEAYKKGREKYLRKKAYADAMGGGGGGLAGRLGNLGMALQHSTSGSSLGGFSFGSEPPKRSRPRRKEKKRPTKHRRRSHRKPEYPDYW